MLAGPIDRNRNDARTEFGERLIIAESRAPPVPAPRAARLRAVRGRVQRSFERIGVVSFIEALRGNNDLISPQRLPHAKRFRDIGRAMKQQELLALVWGVDPAPPRDLVHPYG